MNLCPRKSVGAIIKDDWGRHLCLYRKKHPVGLAGVAGHFDFTDEENQVLEHPFSALKREVMEESGLVVNNADCVLHKTFPNPCAGGYSSHEWYVYGNLEWEGMSVPRLMEPDKHEFVKFMAVDEIMEYVFRNDVDSAWLYIWTYLGL